jgi:hypothetical protein
MLKLLTQSWPLLLVCLLFSACGDDEDVITPAEDPDFAELESEWVRLTLLRENEIELMQTNTGNIISTTSVGLPEGARYYTSNSGRYLVVTDRGNNKLRFFDSGVINHVDHGHQENVGWLDLVVEAPLPTHYASTGGHIVIFNDGDGSITYVNEAQLELPGYEPKIFTFPTVAHHGAGFRLRNGQFATTFKNNTEPGGIPQMVKFLDSDGNLIDDNGGVEVEGIHGDATNGEFGVFGSTDGIILVDDRGNIDLIPNIDSLSGDRGYWIGSVKGHDNTTNFFGRAREVGAFLINPIAMSLTPLYVGKDVAGDMLSADGAHYILHTTDNHLRVYDSATGNLIADRAVEMVNIPNLETGLPSEPGTGMDENDPVLVTSDKYLYILAPNRTTVKVLEIASLKHVHTIALDASVQSIAKNGFTEE